MFGGTGRNSLYGGTGDDLLDGGEDNDLLIGGGGADTFCGVAGTDTADPSGSLVFEVDLETDAMLLSDGTQSQVVGIEIFIARDLADTINGALAAESIYAGR